MGTRCTGRPRAGPPLLLALALLAAGCSRPTGTVTGKVTFKGDALPYGRVTLISKEGKVASAEIRSDGTYTVTQAPVGEAQVTVEAVPLAPVWPGRDEQGKMLTPDEMARAGGKKQPPAPKPPAVVIPPRYKEPGQSGLSVTVAPGTTTQYDIKLTP